MVPSYFQSELFDCFGERNARKVEWSYSDELVTIGETPSANLYVVFATRELRMIRRIAKISGWIATIAFVGFSFASETRKESTEERRERLRIAVQEICPVSGKSLTDKSAGKTSPVKWTDPETKEVLYVCCKDCLQSKPDAKYLEKIRSNFAKAQSQCLVMTDNEVSEKSKHGIISGHFVYVCCPPCVKKMTASPEKYLSKLDDLYEASLKK